MSDQHPIRLDADIFVEGGNLECTFAKVLPFRPENGLIVRLSLSPGDDRHECIEGVLEDVSWDMALGSWIARWKARYWEDKDDFGTVGSLDLRLKDGTDRTWEFKLRIAGGPELDSDELCKLTRKLGEQRLALCDVFQTDDNEGMDLIIRFAGDRLDPAVSLAVETLKKLNYQPTWEHGPSKEK